MVERARADPLDGFARARFSCLLAAARCVLGAEVGIYLDAGKRRVDGDVACKGREVLGDDESVAFGLEMAVLFFWLILSQPQLRTPSAIGHVDAQDGCGLVVEMLVELLLARLGQCNHE